MFKGFFEGFNIGLKVNRDLFASASLPEVVKLFSMTTNEVSVDGLAAVTLTFSGHSANGETGCRHLAAAVAFEFCTVLGEMVGSWISAHKLELCLVGSASGRARFDP
jgi:hypothetical protein